MPDGGAAEAALTADWNAERVERMRRYPRLRDRSMFVGNPADLVDTAARPRPADRARVGRRSATTSPATSPAARRPADREELRAELGYRPDEQVCVVDRRRLGGRHATCCAGPRQAFPPAEEAGARAADGVVDRAADRPGVDLPRPTASRSAATCPTCTGTWPPATWRSCRAG